MYTHRITLECFKDPINISVTWAKPGGCDCGCKSKLAGILKIPDTSIRCALFNSQGVLYKTKNMAKKCIKKDKMALFIIKTIHYTLETMERNEGHVFIDTNEDLFKLPTTRLIEPAPASVLFSTTTPQLDKTSTQIKNFNMTSPKFQKLLKQFFIN